jgi:hypothetical protein
MNIKLLYHEDGGIAPALRRMRWEVAHFLLRFSFLHASLYIFLFPLHSPTPACAEVKNECSCTSAARVCVHGVKRDNFAGLTKYLF